MTSQSFLCPYCNRIFFIRKSLNFYQSKRFPILEDSILHTLRWLVKFTSQTPQRMTPTDYQMERTLYWSAPLVSLLTYFYLTPEWLTPLSRVLSKKLTGPQLVKKFPTFYGNHRFSAVCTTARHLFMCWATSIQSMFTTYFLKIHFKIILPSMLRSQSGPFPSRFLTKTPYERLLSSSTC